MPATLLLAAIAACLLLASGAQAARREVILTTDCGTEMDDQWALAHLALSPRIDLVGVVTTHAPNLPAPAAEATARCAREVLDRLPVRAKPPVMPGSSAPLADARTPRMNDGVRFILEHACTHGPGNRLTVLVIGAATDVASVLLADPSVADRIEIVAMGFLDWQTGGQEWNVHNDVAAWQVLLQSRVPLTVGDQAVCKKDLLMNDARATELFAGRGEAGRYLVDLLVEHVTRHGAGLKSITDDERTWVIWDSVTVAWLLGLAKSEERPRPMLDDDCVFRHGAQERGRTVRWITSVQSAKLWGDLATRLGRRVR